MKNKLAPQYYSPKDCAEILGVTKAYILSRVAQGHLKAYRLSTNQIRINKDDFNSWLNSIQVSNG